MSTLGAERIATCGNIGCAFGLALEQLFMNSTVPLTDRFTQIVLLRNSLAQQMIMRPN